MTDQTTQEGRLHATTVAIAGQAVAIRGPAGAGKSDLALRLIDRGAALIADDVTLLRESGGLLWASAPEEIAGLLEVRGLGVVAMAPGQPCPLALVVDLVPAAAVARLPDETGLTLLGCHIPLLAQAPFEASAPLKVELALRQVVRR
jgi:serine kinase of HPr protein (carbohydrate metabolism regulator)